MESEGGVQAEGGDGGGLPTLQSWRETLCGAHTPSPSQHAFRICKRTWELRGELVFAASSERAPDARAGLLPVPVQPSLLVRPVQSPASPP